jgi:hypothetical protein
VGRLRGLALAALLVALGTCPLAQAQNQSADDLVVGYRALGASSLVEESYEVEVLRWTAISELVNASISEARLNEWRSALPGLQEVAGIYDRDARTTADLSQSVLALTSVVGLKPFASQTEAATWTSIVQGAIDQVVGDSLAIFSSRTSSTEGIAALGLGIQAERAFDPAATSKLQPLLDSEQALLDRDLDRADRRVEQARDWASFSQSKWNPIRFALLHRGLNKVQSAESIYHRHGATESEQNASLLASTIASDLRASYPSWAAVVLVTAVLILAASLYVQHRLATWNVYYVHARRANFLMGAPR